MRGGDRCVPGGSAPSKTDFFPFAVFTFFAQGTALKQYQENRAPHHHATTRLHADVMMRYIIVGSQGSLH